MAVRAAAGTPDLLTSGARKPPTTTYSELQGVLFSSLLAFAYLLSSLAFLVLIADLRSFSGKVLAGLWFLIPYYSGNLHGMMLAPDYLNWLLPVGLVMVKVFSRWDVIADVAWSRRDLIFLAAFAALASAVKPTMAIYAFSVAVALLISRPRIWTSLVFCMLAAISAIAGYLLILSFFYHGNPSHLKMFFELEQVFLSTAAQSSPAYFSWVKANITSSWMVGGAIVLPFVSVLAMCVTRRRKAVGPVVGIGVGALVYQVVLYSRFVPSTQFEAGIFVQCALV